MNIVHAAIKAAGVVLILNLTFAYVFFAVGNWHGYPTLHGPDGTEWTETTFPKEITLPQLEELHQGGDLRATYQLGWAHLEGKNQADKSLAKAHEYFGHATRQGGGCNSSGLTAQSCIMWAGIKVKYLTYGLMALCALLFTGIVFVLARNRKAWQRFKDGFAGRAPQPAEG